MKTNRRSGKAAFTLIELMAVITIIVILAGLVVGGLSFVSDRQAKEKARVQLALLSKALDEYKLDNGSYPATGNLVNGENASSILFKALYWDSDNDGSGPPGDTDQKIYVPELDPATTKQGWTSGTASAATKIMDPWGNEYRYRSALNASGTANSNTQNADFDLWSVGKDARTQGGSSAANIKHVDNRDDIRNF